MANYLNFTKATFNPYNPKVLNEGQFSWITYDTDKQIGSERENTIDVYMYDDKGNQWYEKGYEGYGEFGKMDYYELLARMNGFTEEDLEDKVLLKSIRAMGKAEMRDIGIALAFDPKGKKIKTRAKGGKVLFPALVENPKFNWKRHDFTQEAESDPNQSWYQEEESDDDYDDDYEQGWYESLKTNEGAMSEIHIMAKEAKDAEDFKKQFYKEYGAKVKKSGETDEWIKELYVDATNESVTEATDEDKPYFDFLVALRDSGATNMFGASPYLQDEFGLSKSEARKILSKWMKSFSESVVTEAKDPYKEIEKAIKGMKGVSADIKGDTIIVSNKAGDEFTYSMNDADDIEEFIATIEESVVTESIKCTNKKGHSYKEIDKDGTVECEHCGLRNSLSEEVEEVTEAKFVKDFDKDVLDAETKADITTYYPSAKFFIGKLSHFFGELEPNLFFKAYYAKYYKEDTGKKIDGDFKITSIYSEKGRNYVNLYLESADTVEAPTVNEAEVKSDEDFKEYAFAVLGKAFGDKFDEEKAQEVVDGLLSKHGEDYGAAVGALTASLG
jgi:hypothetical protein